MRSDTAWKVVLFSVAVTCLSSITCLYILTINQLAELQVKVADQQVEIEQLHAELYQTQQSYLGHVSQQEDFYLAMKKSAIKAGYWWAYRRMSLATGHHTKGDE